MAPRHGSLLLLVGLALSIPAAAANARGAGGPTAGVGPSVIGTVAAGKRLTGLSGAWSGSGVIVYHFQWYRCNGAGAQCLAIAGATSPTYALVERDIGKTLGLTVSAADATGRAFAYSNLVGPVASSRPLLESTIQPAVSGPPVQGKSIEVSPGGWSPVPEKITYTWARCNANGRACAAIPHSSGPTYRLGAADIGHALVALVQAKNGTITQSAYSTPTPAAVGRAVDGPALTAPPGISGAPIQGRQVGAAAGIWKTVGPLHLAFQWYRCDTTGSNCSSIHGATASKYELVAKDAGETIGLTVNATDATGTSTAYSSLVGPVAGTGATLTPTAAPAISGSPTAGGLLTVDDGLWTSTPGSYAYSWLRCNEHGRLCTVITGAKASTYKPTAADTGHALIADVRAADGAVTQDALSAATAPVR